LFIATGSGSFLSGLGRRQVGEPHICFRGHLCGYRPPRRRGSGAAAAIEAKLTVSTSSWQPSSPARPAEERSSLMARLGRPMEGFPPWQWSPPRRRRGLSPPFRVQIRVVEQEDCKGVLLIFGIIGTWQLAKTATPYLEDSTSSALRLRICRWPFGTGGKAPANSKLWSEELSRHAPPSVPSLAGESTHSEDSPLPRTVAGRIVLVVTAAAGRGPSPASSPARGLAHSADSLRL
jgi:hypothetical protein